MASDTFACLFLQLPVDERQKLVDLDFAEYIVLGNLKWEIIEQSIGNPSNALRDLHRTSISMVQGKLRRIEIEGLPVASPVHPTRQTAVAMLHRKPIKLIKHIPPLEEREAVQNHNTEIDPSVEKKKKVVAVT